jgi:UDP-N-acetylmuramoyl-tripeptide--D-alanyl-D-alanine ligase
MNPFSVIAYHLYLLQLEHYHVSRYLNVLRARPMPPRAALRKPLVWTVKLRAIAAVAAGIAAALAYALFRAAPVPGALFLIASPYISGTFFALATVLLLPIDIAAKRRIIEQARRRIKQSPHLKIIGITGSYGKTTMKEAVSAILAESRRVVNTKDSINTPLGIARQIIGEITPEIEWYVVEMGAHREGDIRELCAITPPDISIITGVNEAHLERFGSLEATERAKGEIVRYAKPEAVVIANGDDERAVSAALRNAGARAVVRYGMRNERNEWQAHEITINPDGLRQSFAIAHGADRITAQTALIGNYAPALFAGAAAAASAAGIAHDDIRRGIGIVKPVPHRLEPRIANGNILVIDDSYNGNPAGAREAMNVLARFTGRRTIYVTPGLVETGAANARIHRELGRELAGAADLVVLIDTTATREMRAGLEAAHMKPESILVFPDAPAAHRALPGIIRENDVVLFQNDWPENYW